MNKTFASGLFFALLILAGFNNAHLPAPCLPDAGQASVQAPVWGFFAHKRINRLAVLTLPPEMMAFFKPNIDWLTDHAVDPDMRRYASKNEAPRHFIDLDVYGSPPFDSLPQLWADAMIRYTDLWIVKPNGDTSLVFGATRPLPDSLLKPYKDFFFRQLLPRYYAGDNTLDADSLNAFFQNRHLPWRAQSAFYQEHLSEHGIVPWHLQKMQRDLTEAFRQRNSRRILRICADMGHYVADAHVPLHTSSNYNGQKTGQHGIHGFWESRVPELFADEQYDFWVGKPEYIPHPPSFFWQAVFDSHSMVDSVLDMERQLRITFPSDRQMCPDMRNGLSVLAPCREYAAAYQTALQDMMERRMRAAIHAVGSAWYTAWVDAGQPDLSKMDLPAGTEAEMQEEVEMKKMFGQGKILGRPEEH